jgi:hypothetical protein
VSGNRATEVELKNEAFLDEIKDEIDRLHEIKSVKQRAEAARDLVEYIQLHYTQGGR